MTTAGSARADPALYKEKNMKLWTVTSEYSATGEGHTLMAIITYASDEDTALKAFKQEFGDFFEAFAVATEGVDLNDPVIKGLFNSTLLERVLEVEGNANVTLKGSFHVNFS